MTDSSLADIPGIPIPEIALSCLQKIPAGVLDCVDRIVASGGAVWLVGGAVREAMLGRAPKDWDLAVSPTPQRMLEIFPDAIPTGIRFGTVTLRAGEVMVEATTLRGEGSYGDGRRPDEVSWSDSLAADLARRDFTFNAMAVDLKRWTLHDPFEGRLDLENSRLRAVGDPRLRLSEDGLRIMRAYRFQDLGSEVLCRPDSGLKKALLDCQRMLSNVAAERIWHELLRILEGRNAGQVIRRMVSDGVLDVILPGRWEPSQQVVRAQISPLLRGIDPLARLALLFFEQPLEGIEQGLRACKASTASINTTLDHRRWFGTAPTEGAEGELRRYRHVLARTLSNHLRLEQAHEWARLGEAADSIERLRSRIGNLPASKAGESALMDGNRLMRSTGIGKGQRLGRLKEWLHRIQVERDIDQVDEIESVLCTLPWQHGEPTDWPRLAWP